MTQQGHLLARSVRPGCIHSTAENSEARRGLSPAGISEPRSRGAGVGPPYRYNCPNLQGLRGLSPNPLLSCPSPPPSNATPTRGTWQRLAGHQTFNQRRLRAPRLRLEMSGDISGCSTLARLGERSVGRGPRPPPQKGAAGPHATVALWQRGPAPGSDELALSDVSWAPPPVLARCGHRRACRCG